MITVLKTYRSKKQIKFDEPHKHQFVADKKPTYSYKDKETSLMDKMRATVKKVTADKPSVKATEPEECKCCKAGCVCCEHTIGQIGHRCVCACHA